MSASLHEWDAKHRAAAQGTAVEAASFVRELLPLLPHYDVTCASTLDGQAPFLEGRSQKGG